MAPLSGLELDARASDHRLVLLARGRADDDPRPVDLLDHRLDHDLVTGVVDCLDTARVLVEVGGKLFGS